MKRFILTSGVLQWDEAKQRYITVEKKGYWYDGPMALCMDSPTINQQSIQVFNDDGTDETDSTAKAGVSVDIINQSLDENLLIRFLLTETAGNSSNNFGAQLEVRLNGGTYQNVDAASTIARSSASTKLTENNDTTQRIGAGTFITTNQGQDDADGSVGRASFAGNDETEFVCCVQIRSAEVSAGDNVDFRLVTVDVYIDPEIKVTIVTGGGPILKSIAGSLTPTGALIKETLKNVIGSVTPTGALIKETLKILAGTLTPTNVLGAIRLIVKSIAGSLAPTGTVAKSTFRLLIGTVTPAGALVKDIFKSFVGSLTPTGNNVKETSKILAGTLTPVSTLGTIVIFIRNMVGSFTPVGTIRRDIFRSILGALTPVGGMAKRTNKPFAGSLGFVGGMAKRTNKFFTGSMTPSGALGSIVIFLRSVAGLLTPSGILATLKIIVSAAIDQFNDLATAVVGPQLDDGLLAHYKANGATSNCLNDAEYQYLIARGISATVLADMWEDYLNAKGYTGNVTEMKYVWWKAGAPL